MEGRRPGSSPKGITVAGQRRNRTGFAGSPPAGGYVPGAPSIARHTPGVPVRAAILTIGNEVVSGDVPNTNAVWLAQRLETLGVRVVLAAAVPDEIEAIAAFVKRERDAVDNLIVTGGLGGTPD